MITEQQLRQMAETADKVRRWAQKMGLKKEAQMQEVSKGLKADLRDFGVQVEDEA